MRILTFLTVIVAAFSICQGSYAAEEAPKNNTERGPKKECFRPDMKKARGHQDKYEPKKEHEKHVYKGNIKENK